MTVTALPGNVRLRAFQLGPETTWATAVAATRRYPWSFAPTVEPHWTTPTADTGTLGNALPPYRTAIDVTGQSTGQLAFDDIPTLMAAFHKPITPSPSGTAITYTDLPAETSQDNFQTFTGEWGDEVTGDQFRYVSGVLESVELSYPPDLGPINHTGHWRFASATYPYTRTGALTVDLAPIWAYGADTSLYIDSTAGGIGGTAIVNSLHDAKITMKQALDVKRFMNGSNTRFLAAGYGRGLREVETSFTFAKSTAALVEAANWLAADPVARYLSVKTVSPTLIPTSAVPYSTEVRFAGEWFTRTEATHGNANTAFTLVCRSRYNATLTYNQWWQTICARAAI